MKRDEILQVAGNLINGDRARDYGSAERNFDNIAKAWEIVLGVPVTPPQVCLCMAMLKIARLSNGVQMDSYHDAIGYLALGGELASET